VNNYIINDVEYVIKEVKNCIERSLINTCLEIFNHHNPELVTDIAYFKCVGSLRRDSHNYIQNTTSTRNNILKSMSEIEIDNTNIRFFIKDSKHILLALISKNNINTITLIKKCKDDYMFLMKRSRNKEYLEKLMYILKRNNVKCSIVRYDGKTYINDTKIRNIKDIRNVRYIGMRN